MKKLVFLMGFLLSTASLMAQSVIETIYLKNGGLVRGEIIEQVPGQSLKVKTKDGNMFVYQMDEVERIVKEDNTAKSGTQKKHPGVDLMVDAGYDINTKGGGGAIATEVEIGKRFSKNIYWGVGSGAWFSTTSGGGVTIPITTGLKAYFPSASSSIIPFVSLKGGYSLNTENSDYGGVLLSIMPGIQYPLSNKVDLNLGAGYTHVIYDGGSGGAIAIRAGFGFHRDPTKPTRYIPTRDHGFQITLEGGMTTGGGGDVSWVGNVVASYKLNPHLSLGIGGGIEDVNIVDDEGWAYQYDIDHSDTHIRDYHGSGYEDINVNTGAVKAFVRAQYRVTDKRFSPFASCDAGMRFYNWHGSPSKSPYPQAGEPDDEPSTSFFASPSVGLSLRTFNNSYLELKAGYSFAPGLKSQIFDYDNTESDRVKENNRYVTYTTTSTYHVERKKINLSNAFIMLSWTHTFGPR